MVMDALATPCQDPRCLRLRELATVIVSYGDGYRSHPEYLEAQNEMRKLLKEVG